MNLISILRFPAFIICCCIYFSACNTRPGKLSEDLKMPHMNGIDYLLSFSSALDDDHSWVKLSHIMDSSKFMMGYGSNGQNKNMYSLKEGQNKIHQIISDLKAMPGISDVRYVALDRSYNNQTINDTRKFLYESGLDTKSIPDAELRTYFASLFAGESKYVLHTEASTGFNRVSPAIISLQADLIRKFARQDDSTTTTRVESVTTIGEVTIERISFTVQEEAPEPPDVPPPKK